MEIPVYIHSQINNNNLSYENPDIDENIILNLFLLSQGLLVSVLLVGCVHGYAQYEKPPDWTCPEFGVYPCNCTAESDQGIAIECYNTNLGKQAVTFYGIFYEKYKGFY